jgi:hypothetical protein
MKGLYFSRLFMVVSVVVSTLFIQTNCQAAEDYSQWTKSKQFFINTSPTGYDIATDIVSFPYIVRLGKKVFRFSEANAQGNDIRFSNAAGTPLAYQIERWDTTAQTAVIWVSIDTVKANNATQFITMYWGKSDAPAVSNGPAVFDTAKGYAGVWHLSNDLTDATSRGNNCINTGGIADTVLQAMKAWYLNGTDDFLAINPPWNASPAGMTISAWIRPDKFLGTILYLGNKGETNFFMSADAGLQYYHKFTDGLWFGTNGSTGSLVAKQWGYITAVWEKGKFLRIYINGAKVSSRDSIPDQLLYDAGSGFRCSIGANNQTTAFFSGAMYDVRVKTISDSSDYIKLSYLTQKIGADSPPTIKYPAREIKAISGGAFNPVVPLTTELIDSFTISPSKMPVYLYFDTQTGTIAGYPSDTCTNSIYYIRAYNNLGYSEDTISLTVTKPATSVFGSKRPGTIPELLGVRSLSTQRIFFSFPESHHIYDVSFILYDSKGAVVWTSRMKGSGLHSGLQSIEINVRSHRTGNSGIYFLKMITIDSSGKSILSGKATLTLLR